MQRSPLVAGNVHRDLWAALEPVLTEIERAAEMWPGAVPLEDVRLVVQLHPLTLQLVRAAREDRPARCLAVFSGDKLPDAGRALAEAAEALVGGVLAAHGMTVTEGVAEVAAVPGGGLAVVADPTTGAAEAIVAAPGVGMEQAVKLGGITEMVTEH
jgi:hypothetical protein